MVVPDEAPDSSAVCLETPQTDGGKANYIGSDICVNSVPTISTRDDPDLERMLKEKARWGDPMTHFVKVTALTKDLG
ncbi:BUD13 protein [Tanacetum coccineum]